MKTENLNVRMSAEVKKLIEQQAAANYRSMSAQIEYLVREEQKRIASKQK